MSELFGNIWHQGTVYEATSHAVPFLVEILSIPGADTAGVLGLLGSILRGGSYEDAHWGLWSKDQQASPERIAKRARELRHVDRAVSAVIAHARTLASFAGDPRVEVRRVVPYLLIVPEFPSNVVARTVEHALANEDDALTLCGHLLTAGQHALTLPVALDLDDPRPLVRIGLAAVHVRTASAEPEAGTLVVLADSVAEAFEELTNSDWAADADFVPWLLFYLRTTWRMRLALLARWSQADSADLRYYAACFIGDEVALSPKRGPAAVPLLERWVSEESDTIVASMLRDALDVAQKS